MTKKYRVPGARVNDWPHPAPDRTAYRYGRGLDSDAHCVVFSNRAAMLQACKMSDTSALDARPYRPVIKEA